MVTVDNAQHVIGQALAIWCDGDIGIKLVEGRDLFADGAVLLVFAVIVVIEDSNESGAAVQLPEWEGLIQSLGKWLITSEPAPHIMSNGKME
ncbi:hypothetical protein AU05_12615 [Ectopseudomonas composti]|uniref:Uncharacterized protein n=1 Tax=Ectopseudomonas composti TaxID=658457 RepID=A0ABP3BWA8_9GAMM|nr:hypothetical protein AU05_12615 [Pseudomonas composti]